MREKCESCKIFIERDANSVCAWYLENVVCGDKTTEDCTAYIPYVEEGAE